MKRRKAIAGIFALTAIGAASYAGWNLYGVTKNPQLKTLDDYTDMLADLVEIIIPSTDTPGAKSVGVQHYVVLIIKEATGKKDQNNFINGLNDFRAYCLSNYGEVYEKCAHIDKIKALDHFEKKASYRGIIGKVKNKFFGKSFFSLLKDLTVEGYCTSEIGATQHLAYQYVPGEYNACMDINENQKTWATK